MKKAAASAIDTGTRAVYDGRRQQADGGAREPHPQGQSAAPLQVAGAPQQAGRHDPADGAPEHPADRGEASEQGVLRRRIVALSAVAP